MNNKLDYFLHKVYNPPYYQRNFENDLPKEEEESTVQKAKRACLIALPFLSLYRPFASTLSIGMGTVRLSTEMIQFFSSKGLSDGAYKVMKLGLAALAVAGTLYQFTLGTLVTTGSDCISSMISLVSHLLENQHAMAFEEFLQLLSTSLYLGIMVYGSLEIVIASILLQAALNLYQAKRQWSEGKSPEAFAKVVMGMVRLFQANGQYGTLQRRNALLRRYADLVKRVQKGRQIDHLWDHPLIHRTVKNRSLEEETGRVEQSRGIDGLGMGIQRGQGIDHLLDHPLDNGTLPNRTLEDINGVEYDCGINGFGMGGQLVKGMNVNLSERKGKAILQFKINHLFREKLGQLVSELQKVDHSELGELLKIYNSRIKHISITEQETEISDFFDVAKELRVDLEGLGSIHFGASGETHTLHNRITVEMDQTASLYDFHEALALLNLDDALRASAKEDFERMKLGHLFHLFSPKEATLFVREDDYFDLELANFKREIIKRDPHMEDVFATWLDRLSFRETLPGKMRLAVDGLAEEAIALGTRGLTTTLTGAWSQEDANERIGSILKMGMVSSETRHTIELGCPGLSWGADYFTGGADSVFTSFVTEKNQSFDEFGYAGEFRIHFSPKVLEMGTYQYHTDNFGMRNTDPDWWWWWWLYPYLERPTLFDFVEGECQDFCCDNEVMVKDRIPPELITGISVANQSLKSSLLDYLRNKEMCVRDDVGQERILGKPIDQFVWVGDAITEEQFQTA